MNKFKSFFSLALLCSSALINADCSNVCANDNAGIRSFILPRSQGSNTAMELVGWQDFIHQCDTECFYGVADIRFEYSRTFRPERIAEQLFGASTLHFQGSNVKAGLVNGTTPRNDALLADNFGLSTNYDGAICFRPRIDNFIVDFNFYLGLDNWLCGLYFEAHLPIVHTRWTLFDCGKNKNNCNVNGTTASSNGNCGVACPQVQDNIASSVGATPFLGGYMNVGAQGAAAPEVATAPDLLTALSGKFLFGDMSTPWTGGIISSCRLNKTRLADLELQLGWDFLKSDCYHLGAFLEIVAPTGGRPAYADHLFSPVVGNGGHTEVGAGMSGHMDLWGCDGHCFSVWMYGNVTHGFKKSQTRTFDFNDGPFSRYILLKELDATGTTYSGNMINAVNYTTRTIETEIRVKGDASFKLAYNYCGFRFDLGYNIYGDSGERCASRKNCNQTVGATPGAAATVATVNGCALSACNGLDTSRVFGKKGCQGNNAEAYLVDITGLLNGFDAARSPNPIALNATASNATGLSCGTIDSGAVLNVLPDIALAYNSNKTTGTPITDPSIVAAMQSTTPKRVSLADLNICSGLARSQVTHKVFGYAGYNWMDSCYTPFIGFLWEVEFAQGARKNNCTTGTSSNNCSSNGCNFNNPVVDFSVAAATGANANCGSNNKHRGGVSVWGVGLKGGLTF